MQMIVSMLSMLLMLVVLIRSSQAVTCYECIPGTSPDCGEPFIPGRTRKTCTGESCLTIQYGSGDQLLVERSCSSHVSASHIGCRDIPGSTWRHLPAHRQCYCVTYMCNGRGSLYHDLATAGKDLTPGSVAMTTTKPMRRTSMNGAAMTSSFGHVITAAVSINIAIYHLL